MSIVKSDHGLLSSPTPAASPNQAQLLAIGKSAYCYLWPTLANDEANSLFPGTDPNATLIRLQALEYASHPPPNAPPMPRMNLPAIYTYFGQFVNHDISAPVGGMLVNVHSLPPEGVLGAMPLPGIDKQVRADSICPILEHFVNEQTHPLMLDSLYADGPDSDDAEVRRLYVDGMRFDLGRTAALTPEQMGMITKTPFGTIHRNLDAYDIPRDGPLALIADRRNDENLILSQMHLALMILHNKAVDALFAENPNPAKCFKAARQLVTLHYHWCVVHDFLQQVLSKTVLRNFPKRSAPRTRDAGKVPMEFTTAAFRFGHSMISEGYDFNANFGKSGRIADQASLVDLFSFTSRGAMAGQAAQLPDHWVADWNRLSRVSADQGSNAEGIDLAFAPTMLNLPGLNPDHAHSSIVFRNIMRGFHRRIPFGQVLAAAYDLPCLDDEQIKNVIPTYVQGYLDAAVDVGILTHTPAWLYFLCEAQALEGGQRLGPTASHIIVDTITALLSDNPQSLLNVDQGKWHPSKSQLTHGHHPPLLTIADLLLFAVKDTGNHIPA